MSNHDLLNVKNLCVNFESEHGAIIAVNDISYKIKKRETLALVGESGSGKSVSAMALMRLTDITNGIITQGNIQFFDSNRLKSLQKCCPRFGRNNIFEKM